MVTSRDIATWLGALGGILIFRGIMEIPSVGGFIHNNPYVVITLGTILMVFGGKIAGTLKKD